MMNTVATSAPHRTDRVNEPILFRRFGAWTRIVLPDGAAGKHLRRLFDTTFRVERVAAAEIRTGVSLERKVQPLADERVGPLALPVGYEPLVVQLAESAGVPYVLTGDRPSPLPQPKCADGGVDARVTAAVAANERLVVRVGPAVDVAALIALICNSFRPKRTVAPVERVEDGGDPDEANRKPRPRIVTLIKRVEDARRIVQHLREAGVGVSLFTGQDTDNRTFERVAVATYRRAGDERVGLSDADLLVVHDAADVFGVDGREAIRLAHRDHPTAPRVVGFASVAFTPSLNQYAGMLSLYGTAEVTVPAPGVVNRAVEYMFLPVAGLNSHTRGGSGCDTVGGAKNLRVWRNPIRNRLVAKLAGGFAGGDAATVSNRFPELAAHRLVGRHAAVLVVVENDVHARALLHGPLRGWFAVGPDIGCISQPTSWGQVPRRLAPAVCTFAGLADVNVAGYDVVVRADAGAGALPLPADALYTATADPLLLVVDFEDFRDPVLAPLAEGRQDAYRADGWEPVGGTRHRELDRFLDRHPHGESVRRRMVAAAKRFSDGNRPL